MARGTRVRPGGVRAGGGSTEPDNRMVWDGTAPGHYEVWFLTLNHRASRTGYWIRCSIESPLVGRGEGCGRLWFAHFDQTRPQQSFAINSHHPLADLRVTSAPFELQLPGALVQHDAWRGELSGDAHAVSWDLRFQPSLFTHRPLPPWAYDTRFVETKVVSPNPVVRVRGEVLVDGRRHQIEDDPGSQTHLWGRRHAHAWAWSECVSFREDPTAALQTISVRLKRGPIVLPLTMISLYLGGEVYHLRGLRQMLWSRGQWGTAFYRFAGRSGRAKIAGELRCRPEDMIRTRYRDPDGDDVFCHNTEVADCAVTLFTRRSPSAPFLKALRLTSRGLGHFEYASRTPDLEIARRHVTVR